jgi:PmbA protein
MMFHDILDCLKKRDELAGWTVRHVVTRGAQLYAVPRAIESRRIVDGEKFQIDVLMHTRAPDGSPAVGSGDVTLLPGGDIEAAINQASLVASLVSNPVHGLPAPADLPDIPLVDAVLQEDAAGVMQGLLEEMRLAASRNERVRLTAGECFGDLTTIHLVNSQGIDALQESTQVDVEFVLHAQEGAREVETFGELSRRRASDLHLAAEIEEKARYTLDLLDAAPPPDWQGPVVLRTDALANFMAADSLTAGVLRTLGSAASKYAKYSTWEIGKPVFPGEVKGDPLTVWANRVIPYGTGSDLFDEEGLPARRLELIRDNQLVNFAASQRYADYLGLPPTGAFGGVEVAPGVTDSASLLAEPYVEIIQFSWFNPDSITGNFATEIRLGYMVENGARKPFKGGLLIGNYMDALADVRWSRETAFFGSYLGPHTARFNELKIAGES